MESKSVLISGVGIAGPTLAYWLLRGGFTPALVERAPHFRSGGYMIDFWGAGFEVADRMGLIPELRNAGYTIDHVAFVHADGSLGSELGAGTFKRAVGDRFLSIRRGDLALALYRRVEGEVETVFGDTVTGFAAQGEKVGVTFAEAPPREFDLVVGADGLRSEIRALTLGKSDSFERYLGYYAASFVTDGYPERDEHTYLSFAAPGCQISRYALRDDRTAFLFVVACGQPVPDTAHDRAAQKRLLTDAFDGTGWREWPEIRMRLLACDDLYFDAVSQITLPYWSAGRVALVGDAAYAPSLLAGEGSSFAMAGAYILAGELARAGGDYAPAFAAYEEAFRPFIERKQEGARGFAAGFAPKSRFGLFVRDQVLRLSGIPAVSGLLARRYVSDDFTLPEYHFPDIQAVNPDVQGVP